jgi:hypothetical protein
MPERLQTQIGMLLDGLGDVAAPLRIEAERVASELQEMIESNLKMIPHLDEIRKGFGTHQGRIGNLNSSNTISEIWKIVEPHIPGVSIDQFFGIESIGDAGHQSSSLFYKIISCHMVLNIVGFQPDKRMSDPNRTSNIMSDGSHAAFAAFCDLLVTADQRLCTKAKAIYQYLDLPTAVAMLELPNQSPIVRASRA